MHPRPTSTGPVELRTERLLLRPWSDTDLTGFAALNADPQVMAHFPQPLSRHESDELAHRIRAGFDRHGWGLWALEVIDSGRFIGFTGLSIPGFDAHFTPAVEIGWRLDRGAWGRGYATEAARAAVRY
ncbi:MAG: GNAT family N-acetyltransferase, partial [Stackebrandtia sp.]